MKRIKWFELPDRDSLRPAFRPIQEVRPNPFDKVVGFDTETNSRGDLFLLASDSGVLARPSTEDALGFLLREGRDANNFFFNIRFDLDAILKAAVLKLDRESQDDMRRNNRVRLGDYTIRFIERKFFKIQRGHHTAHFWDVWSFLTQAKTDTGKHDLDSLAARYLNESKDELPFSKDRLFEYWSKEEFRETVERYCQRDAYLTKRLGEFLIATISRFMETPDRFYSKAYLSEYFVRSVIRDVKVFRPFDFDNPVHVGALRYAYRSYKGGIFDISRKGRVTGTQIDLNSAYPFQIANLLDLTRGTWSYVTTPTEDADLGFYRVFHQFDGWEPYRGKSGFVCYPETTTCFEDYITKDEYDFLRDRGKEVRFVDGYEWKARLYLRPFRDLILNLFELKAKYKETDESLYWLVKIILNGIYGKFAQARKSVGRLFNPVYASLITARTRISIAETAEKYFSDVFEVATDSIYGQPRNLEVIKAVSNDQLGSFSLVEENFESVIFQTGSKLDLNQKWVKSRGFSPKTSLDLESGKILLRDRQPLHLRTAIIRGEVERTNEFLPTERELSILDQKRIWNIPEDVKFRDLFERSYSGGRWRDSDLPYF